MYLYEAHYPFSYDHPSRYLSGIEVGITHKAGKYLGKENSIKIQTIVLHNILIHKIV